MSRVLKNLSGLRSPGDSAPAGPRATESSARATRVFGLGRGKGPFRIRAVALAVACLGAGAMGWQHFASPARKPASLATPAETGIAHEELFLRNRQAVLGFYNGNLAASAQEIRALLAAPRSPGRRGEAELRANLGAVLLRQGKFTEARTAFVQALAASPKSAAALHGLGLLALKENEVAEAEEHFRLALAAAPERPETLLSLGQVSELKEEWDEAQGLYARFLATSADATLKEQISARIKKITARRRKGANETS